MFKLFWVKWITCQRSATMSQMVFLVSIMLPQVFLEYFDNANAEKLARMRYNMHALLIRLKPDERRLTTTNFFLSDVGH